MEDDLNYENLMDDVTEAIKKFNLVIFIGAGVSIAQGYPNWNNYIEHLIKYWQGQVLSVSGEKRLGREHHVVFDLISKSSISNKRKVDLVNYELKKVFGEDFEKRRLDFEKGYFKNLLPYSIVNQTVESLASLNAIFITSNYDYEIENHIKRLKNAIVTINDLNEFTKNKNGKLQFGDVLHIHGTPDCDVKYFVSSSADYSKTYLKNRENFENLVTWFKETKPTVLFVGAGLEEDEILSLLCKDSKNYALMKSENTGNQRVDEHYRGVVEGFFSSENHTQIIWYGDEFEKLPLFVKKLVADINEKLGTHDFYNQWNNLLNPSINQEEYNKNLDSISNDFKYLSSVLDKVIENDNNQLDQLMLNALLRSETLTVIKKNFVLAFWRFIVKNIEKLSDNEWDVIYKIIYEGSQNYFIDDVFFVYNYAIDNKISSFTNNNKLNELREIISKDGYIVNSNFNKDKTLLGYWLVSAFEQQNRDLYIKEDSKVSDLLKNHIDDLYPKYKRLYVKIISFPEIEENLRKIVREKYLKRFNKESFDSNDRKFFEYHIKQQNTDIDIFEKLLSINVNELSTPKGDNKQLDILHFINSEMGSYFQCLISLFINHSSYRDVIIQIINSVTDTDYREFAQGILLNEYNPNRINVTYNTFLGFAYYHSTITIEAADVFTDVVRDILNKKIEDNQILNKVYLVALERVDPTIESFSLSKNNYSQMINIIFTGDYEFRYSKEWLGALFKFDSSANYLVTIFYLLYNENLKKNRFALFIEELSDYLTTYNQKLSLRGMNYKLNHEELNNFDLLKKMFLKLMETDKIENDIFYLDGIKSILPLLSLDDRRNVLQHIQKQNNCPPPEIEELQRIIVN